MALTRHKKYSVNVECEINVDPEIVFNAITKNTERWDFYKIEIQDTNAGSDIAIRDNDGNTSIEKIVAFDKDKLFARTEHRQAPNGELFETEIHYYLTKTAKGTLVHVEQSGFEDMMLCEQDKGGWISALAELKAVCEEHTA
ncbi:MAG TPA: SRPBCC domain-containing protein [Candidatus Kapabacteria bacterium]|nr:SRPBCC domain-containing protein [Candidatus Kapabacteria bacterium]